MVSILIILEDEAPSGLSLNKEFLIDAALGDKVVGDTVVVDDEVWRDVDWELSAPQSTLNHQSQMKYAWLKIVPFGQRNE